MMLEDAGTTEDLEQITESVLRRATEDPNAKFPNIEGIVLKYGAKRLSVWIDTADRQISTKVENVSDTGAKPHETTILYSAAKKFMEREVEHLGQKYRYILSTENERLRDWARSQGNEIFRWTNLNEVPNGKEIYASFETSFTPKNYEPDQEIS